MASTAAPEKTNIKHNVTITDVGPCLKKLAIEIPAEEVANQIGTSLDTIMTETELPGFRKGRAPRRLVERRFGSTIRREAKNQLVAQAYTQAIEEHKLKVIGDASSEMLAKLEIEDGKPLAFEVEVEVMPEFELPNLEGIEVKKPVLEVTEEMVSKELERLLLNEGRLESREKPEAGHYLTGHAVMVDQDGKTHYDIQDAVIQIPTADKAGKGMILGVMVEDFGQQLGTPKIGQKVTVKTTGPENHENEAIRGKSLTITFEVKKADEIIPATAEEAAQRYGMASEAELREAIKERITQRLQIEQISLMRQQIAKYLVDSTKMELPARATAAQAARNLERRRMEMLYRGADAQRIEESMAELRNASNEVAVRELKLFFVLNQAAEKLGVKVSDAEMNARIAQIAASRGERPERLRQEIINRNQGGMVFQQVREHKTMDMILAKAKVTEVSVEDFNAAMKASGGETAEGEGGGSGSGDEKKTKAKSGGGKSKKKSEE
jgi:trigger factor